MRIAMYLRNVLIPLLEPPRLPPPNSIYEYISTYKYIWVFTVRSNLHYVQLYIHSTAYTSIYMLSSCRWAAFHLHQKRKKNEERKKKGELANLACVIALLREVFWCVAWLVHKTLITSSMGARPEALEWDAISHSRLTFISNICIHVCASMCTVYHICCTWTAI